MIHLAVGRLEVDWGKNNFFTDHGALFQSTDIKLVPSYYAGDDWPEGDPIVKMNEGFGKPLRQVLARLELLGYTLRAVEHHYNRLHEFHDLDEEALRFDELRQALVRVDVNTVSGIYREDYDLERLALDSEQHNYVGAGLRPDHWEVDLLLENFAANGALRLLAENSANLDLDVSWDFTPLVESGWATRDQFRAGPSPSSAFLSSPKAAPTQKLFRKL
jgi:hypothetical protein